MIDKIIKSSFHSNHIPEKKKIMMIHTPSSFCNELFFSKKNSSNFKFVDIKNIDISKSPWLMVGK